MFQIGDADVSDLDRFQNMLGALAGDVDARGVDSTTKVIARSMNRAGDMARTQVVRELSQQMGLPQKIIRRAVKAKRASWTNLEFKLSASGGNISLKYFKKRETARGVEAWLGEGRGWDWFAESFFRGGRWPRPRVDLDMGGHVFNRVGGRLPIQRELSGRLIPEDMVEDATRKAFEDKVAEVLPRRLDHEIGRMLSRL